MQLLTSRKCTLRDTSFKQFARKKLSSIPEVQCLKCLAGIFTYKDSVTRFFASGFFHESPSPKPLKIMLGSFQIFIENSRRYCILKLRCTIGGKIATGINVAGGKLPLVSTTLAANNGNNIRRLDTLK